MTVTNFLKLVEAQLLWVHSKFRVGKYNLSLCFSKVVMSRVTLPWSDHPAETSCQAALEHWSSTKIHGENTKIDVHCYCCMLSLVVILIIKYPKKSVLFHQYKKYEESDPAATSVSLVTLSVAILNCCWNKIAFNLWVKERSGNCTSI